MLRAADLSSRPHQFPASGRRTWGYFCLPTTMRRMPDSPGHGPSRPSVTLVLPAYNEQARIGSALDELFGYLNATSRS